MENGQSVFFSPYGRVRLARLARVRLLRHALPISLLILRNKTDCFAVHKRNVVLAAMLEGKSVPSNMAANTIHTTLLKKQSAIKYLP